MLSVKVKDNAVVVNSKELNAEFLSNSNGWRLQLDSLGRVARNSKLLKSLYLTNGSVTVYKNRDEKLTRFKADINYPYKLLVKDDKPLSDYFVEGKIEKDKIDFTVNKEVKVKVRDTIKVTIKNSLIDINEGIRAINDINTTQSSSDEPLKLTVNATNSSIYLGNNRNILSDKIRLQYYNNILTAQLKHAKGSAGLKLEDNQFHLYGKDFNDKFIERLFSLSKFNGGKLDFSMSGAINDYDGVFYLSDTTIIDYKILNNILAFINTVPSLVTFSLPGYNDNGLYVKQAYLNFHAKDHAFDISDIYLDSKEIDIVGKGIANVRKDTIAIMLNLKTDLGSNLSKIPIVGYLLLDGDTVSTTLSIEGKLSDPEVKSLIAKDIVVAPLNILKRTLLLPYKLITDITQELNDEK